MRSLFFVLTAVVVMGLAFWAYQENYKTQDALKTAEKYQRDIASTRERLNVLRAEWAYLNRPDRLIDLAEINFDRLGLLSFAPEQFGRVDQIAFPVQEEPELAITNPIDVSTMEQKP